MRYSRVFLDSIGYELAPVVVTSAEIEERLRPGYDALRIPPGQLEAWTGIEERRWWDPGFRLSEGAIAAARAALDASAVEARDLEAVIFAGVCREQYEPATACRIAAELGVPPRAQVYDVSNACLGILNGMIDVANRIELGQLRAGLVVSCETAREVVEDTVERILAEPTMERFKASIATLTGGSGAAAVVLTDGSFRGSRGGRRLLGGTALSAPEHHGLCRWGLLRGDGRSYVQSMVTDSVLVLKHGVELGRRTWSAFLETLGWTRESVDRVICHQVGSGHRDSILKTLEIAAEKDFSTYSYLGNIGTVSLPLTAALADERGFLRPGDRVGLLGIGSGLNCLMLGLEW